MSDLIGKKVFVYMDSDGHYSVFPYETKEDKIAIYEAAVSQALRHVLGPRFEQMPENVVTQEDVDGATSEAAKRMLAGKLAEQKRMSQRDEEQASLLKTLLQQTKDGDDEAEDELIDQLSGHEICLGRHTGYSSEAVITEPVEGRL